jgi:hypothetical protein
VTKQVFSPGSLPTQIIEFVRANDRGGVTRQELYLQFTPEYTKGHLRQMILVCVLSHHIEQRGRGHYHVIKDA